MAYIGSDPNLIDLQNQITTLTANSNAAIAGLQTQIKQVTLTLEGELKTLICQFNTLQDYIKANLPS